ncbi:MAG: hypothetical protein GC165_12170 [Armatimonadetes bacterium]|nr:hypothetical protein [Armatimonadota bacterium]MBS1728119.1 hypothetical protein [Armatimonadota bacterium]
MPVVDQPHIRLEFQHGNPKEVGINGCTIEEVIDVLVDKLAEFQKRGLACKENSVALWHLTSARDVLILRAKVREAQGVRGEDIPHESPHLIAELPPKFSEEGTLIEA